MPCALLGTHAPQARGKSRTCSKTSPAPPHFLLSAGMTSRAPMGTFPSSSCTWSSGREDFCDSCLFFLLYLLHPAAAACGVQHSAPASLCRSLGRHRGMLMSQGGNEASPEMLPGVHGQGAGSGGTWDLSGSSPQPAPSACVFVGKFLVTQELMKEI